MSVYRLYGLCKIQPLTVLFCLQGLLVGTAAFSTEYFVSTVPSEETTPFAMPSIAEFFAMGYNRDPTRRTACFNKLRADGYYRHLTLSERLCICIYNPRSCQNANYQMTPEEHELGVRAFEENARRILELHKRMKYKEQLPRIIGLSTFFFTIFAVGVTGKLSCTALLNSGSGKCICGIGKGMFA